GADTGIDGIIYFKPDGKQTEKAIVSVKGGESVSVPMIRDLGHVVDREKAKLGIFITLATPTRPMQTEAIKTGFYTTPYHGNIPKIQILTIADLFAGKKPQIPFLDSGVFCCLTLVDTESVVRQAGNRSVVPPPDRPPPRRCARVRSDVDAPHRPETASVPW